jgi:hypothetical protein
MYVAAERTPLDLVGACSWTVSFLEDISRIHRGDMPLLQVVSSLSGSPGRHLQLWLPSRGKARQSMVEVAMLILSQCSELRFQGEVTGDIPALTIGGTTCLGSSMTQTPFIRKCNTSPYLLRLLYLEHSLHLLEVSRLVMSGCHC